MLDRRSVLKMVVAGSAIAVTGPAGLSDVKANGGGDPATDSPVSMKGGLHFLAKHPTGDPTGEPFTYVAIVTPGMFKVNSFQVSQSPYRLDASHESTRQVSLDIEYRDPVFIASELDRLYLQYPHHADSVEFDLFLTLLTSRDGVNHDAWWFGPNAKVSVAQVAEWLQAGKPLSFKREHINICWLGELCDDMSDAELVYQGAVRNLLNTAKKYDLVETVLPPGTVL